jgi:hypothetical protein
MRRRAHTVLFGLLLWSCFLARPLLGQTLHDVQTDCGDAVAKTNRSTIESCAAAYLQLPIQPVLKTIAPGGGFGGGLRFKHTFNITPKDNSKAPWKIKPMATAALSYNRFFFLEGSLAFERPPFGCAEFINCKGLTTEEAFKAEFFLRRVEAPGLDFYGIGNSTTRLTHVLYNERWDEGGINIVNPATTWLDVGGAISYLRPNIGPITNGSFPSIGTEFSNLTAPGLTSQPAFLHYRIYVEPHYPGDVPYMLNYVLAYEYYHDLDYGELSFHKFNADVTNTFPLKIHHNFKVDANKPRPVRDWFCGLPRGANKVCQFGDFTVRGVLTLETAAAGQTVPFYLQPTLGGADLQDLDTLRGFADYRFRAPNLMYVQAEYGHTLPWKLQWLKFLTFYDVGRVGNTAGDLGFDELHHDIGLGISVSAANREIARVYIAFGTGEGSRLNGKFGSLF